MKFWLQPYLTQVLHLLRLTPSFPVCFRFLFLLLLPQSFLTYPYCSLLDPQLCTVVNPIFSREEQTLRFPRNFHGCGNPYAAITHTLGLYQGV
ncbi:hypothetical protein B0H13DRAFT_615295 [Mycena leptocephala]|nr:hypothetical protein B0H13DRAFT_615295 [Mycena leptocephala]